mmetsp:Transcript_298/g.971  ORF Transcript_298/g.971 Transcript_298/m.971 type:complete len:268 (+) Transcript_298:1554-2357(+)
MPRFLEVDIAVSVCQVAHLRHSVLVEFHQVVDGALAYVQRRQMRQEIVADEEAHKHEVVDDTLEIIADRSSSPVACNPRKALLQRVLELKVEILAEDPDIQKLERLLAAKLAQRAPQLCSSIELVDLGLRFLRRLVLVNKSALVGHHHLTKNCEVDLVCCEREHDQICVQPVEDVASVWVVSRLGSRLANVLRNFVLALAGHGSVRENDLEVPPCGVCSVSVGHISLKGDCEPCHKRRARRDDVGIEGPVLCAEVWHVQAGQLPLLS